MECNWKRFTDYEIRNGRICPKPGAELETYNLMAYLQARKAWIDAPRPHEELMSLNDQDEKEILAWVGRYGLLGLLPHRLEFVQLDYMKSWSRVAGELDTMNNSTEESNLRPGTAVLRGWYGGITLVDDYQQLFDRYFSEGFFREDSFGVLPVDSPLGQDFWANYTEPLDEFRQFRRMLRQIHEGYQEEKWRTNQGEQARQWVRENSTLTPDTPFEGAERIAVLRASTLISVLASLLWVDWSQGRWFRVCGTCGSYFASTLSEKAWCSDRCRNTGQQRRRRKHGMENAGSVSHA